MHKLVLHDDRRNVKLLVEVCGFKLYTGFLNIHGTHVTANNSTNVLSRFRFENSIL